jgi:CRISPR-associated protein Cst1
VHTKAEPVWFTTGNPFVDVGQEMMAAMAEVDSPDELTTADVEALAPRLVRLYFQEGWNKASHSIFPNSNLNNPAIKAQERRKRYAALLDAWLDMVKSPNERDLRANCAISGRPAQVYAGRMFLPMSDFGGGNFQSGNQAGMPLSASVALALQFFPLGLVKVGKMMALPHFSDDIVQCNWARRQIDRVVEKEALDTGGVQDIGTSRPANAFFKLVEDLVRRQQGLPSSSVTLYLFNNFNQADYKNASELHYMPSPVFRFISSAMGPSGEPAWRRIVWRGYATKKEVEDEDEALRRYDNQVYSRLLRGESISGFFLDRRRRRPAVRGDAGWRLFNGYLREVGGMDQRRIDSLRDLGDRIAPLVRDKSRRLRALEDANSRGKFTDVLYRITKDSAQRDKERPLITFDQLVTDVFPHDAEYSDWREVKYLLLFRIYEQLFDELKDDPEYANEEPEEEEGAA